MRKQNVLGGLSALVVALNGLAVQGSWLEEPAGDERQQRVAIAVVGAEDGQEDDDDKKVEVRVEVLDDDEERAPKLWLGIALKSIDGDLAAFLGSSDGVLIDNVAPDSPAAKAGLQKADIVISVDGKHLSEPQGLLDVMSTAKEGAALQLEVMRRSEKLEISVTPELRKAGSPEGPRRLKIMRRVDGAPGEESVEEDSVFQWIPEDDGDPSTGVHMFRLGDPSVLFVPDSIELKGNISIHMTKEEGGETVEINIVKESEKPAKITVKQGDRVETITEDQLEKLPEELSHWIRSTLGGKKPKWLDLKGALGSKAAGLDLAEIVELKELSKMLDDKDLEGGKVEVKKMLDELTRKAKSQAHDALKKAMEQAGVDADETAQQAKDLARAYAEQALKSAKERAAVAKEAAVKAGEEARAHADALEKSVQQQAQSEQIKELKAMIEQLKKEIAELQGSK